MNVGSKSYRTIWVHPDHEHVVCIIDQTKLPFQFVIKELKHPEDAMVAIANMEVRGAGLIGATAAYGMYLAALHLDDEEYPAGLHIFADKLKNTRPTAVNLRWAVDQQLERIKESQNLNACISNTFQLAKQIADADAQMCENIGGHGLALIKNISEKKNGQPVNILTHCNAGWLAFVDYGSATAPIYKAYEEEIPVHVWVDETRPRNQGARLTAWELGQQGIPHTVIPDNTGGHLMQHGMVDMVITGADRVTRNGDAANKIGTYLKALAAKDNKIPFYVALPSSTIDWQIADGIKEIPIEQRGQREVKYMSGLHEDIEKEVRIMPAQSAVANYGFDVTPARLITGLITERGICKANYKAMSQLFER